MSHVHGNLSHAMRENYAEHGVDEYYRKVASSYRNPFFPGIKKVLWAFLARWWDAEGRGMYDDEAEEKRVGNILRILDMAAGSGEATIILQQWAEVGRSQCLPSVSSPISAISSTVPPQSSAVTSLPIAGRAPFIPPKARRPPVAPPSQNQTLRSDVKGAPVAGSEGSEAGGKKRVFDTSVPPKLPLSFRLDIVATDPYTSPAYHERTGRICHALSFSELAAGRLPPLSNEEDGRSGRNCETDVHPPVVWDMIVCSFALHLLTDPSELFALLYELSSKARWLVVIAPHKKPEVKETWGWTRWDMASWESAGDKLYGRQMDEEEETELEIIREKVKLRLYRSLNA